MLRALAVVLALALSGCVAPEVAGLLRREAAPVEWEVEVEPSMAPDFSGMGPSYPILLVHQHHVASERQREERAKGPQVVCLRAESREPLPLVGAEKPMMADMAACAPPAADPPTGRLRVDRAAFDAASPRGVAVLLDGCGGGAILLGDAERSFLVSTVAHEFRVHLLDNGTFQVDGMWVAPGTTLKVGYWLHRGDARDEEYVRVAFDAPGEWLVSRVGVGEPEPPIPPRPTQGSGLVLDVRLAPESWREPVERALAATPGEVVGLAALRAVHDGARLTELTVSFETERARVTWYGAGRTGDAMRLLGAEEPAGMDAPVDLDALFASHALDWSALRAGAPGEMTDVRLVPGTAWATAGRVALALPRAADPTPCGEDGCVFVAQPGGWGRLVAPQAAPAEGARTFAVLAFAEGGAVEVWWHSP